MFEQIPQFKDVLLARRRIKPYLKRTPMYSYPAINKLIGAEVYIKHENYQPVGAFKVRGGINLISQLNDEERKKGVITVSTGNHGQSVAYASRLFGLKAHVVVPEKANIAKVEAIQSMGAEVIFHGENFDQSRQHCEELAKEYGYRYIHAGNEPLLIAGVATETLEMIEDEPELDTIIVPVGGGSGAAGACVTAMAINPSIMIIGVQAEKSPAAYQSWLRKELIEASNKTFAEGLATGMGFQLPQLIMQQSLSDFILISEEEIYQAMLWMVEKAHTLAEAAGSAPLAAAYRMRDQIKGKKIGLVCSGGNTSVQHLIQAINCNATSNILKG